jgi:hypothetical protein
MTHLHQEDRASFTTSERREQAVIGDIRSQLAQQLIDDRLREAEAHRRTRRRWA